jgi:uncharacterized membrane protein SpoIIM required for sporulation
MGALFVGFLLAYSITETGVTTHIRDIKHVGTFEFTIFYKILFKNLIVGVLISVFGYFTCGLFSIVILFWNGMLIGIIIKSNPIDSSIIPYFVYHGFFEITAFLCFGLIGINGFCFFVNLFRKNIIQFDFSKTLFFFSVIVLFIAAIIETLLISYG